VDGTVKAHEQQQTNQAFYRLGCNFTASMLSDIDNLLEQSMDIVSIADAKNNLSELVEQAANGEAFIIAKDGKPLVKVVPMDAVEERKTRRIGFMDGEIIVPDDFDTMMSKEIEEMFYGETADDEIAR
jgi:prevent-host-death family protein